MTLISISIQTKGGPGSGNWGHRGIPGKVGGSSPRSRGGTPSYGNLSAVDAKANSVLLNVTRGAYDPTSLDRLLRLANNKLRRLRREDASDLQIEVAKRNVVSNQAMVDNNTHWFMVDEERRGKIKSDIVSSISKSTGTSQEDINEIIGEWVMSSNDSSARALSMQEAASEEFGVPLSDWQKGKIDIVNKSRIGGPVKGYIQREDERAVLRDMYTTTQAELKTAGYKSGDTVTLYRGYIGRDYIPDRGTDVNYEGNAMESWSILPSIASSFGRHPRGRVLSMNVPVENVLSTATTGFGCLTEGEFVVLGGVPGQVAYIMSLDDLGSQE